MKREVWAAIIVAALGYFVDIYDLVLFSIVRIPSLRALGVTEADQLTTAIHLLNMQMGGMLIGGILWGILGDRRGRLSVLFGSIALYSVANILNGMVGSVEVYGWLRLAAGIGLAGELGAGITLVSELMDKEKRGYGTTIVASVGILGAIVAVFVGREFDWRIAYYIGGVLGLALLVLRVGVSESGMFNAVRESADVARGSIRLLFATKRRAFTYLNCILIGLPIWFVVGILVTLSKELGAALGIVPNPDPAVAILYCYIGLAAGDLTSGFLSQKFRTRRGVTFIFLLMTGIFIAIYLLSYGISLQLFYLICGGLGFSSGFWAVFVTMASEQFGTNIRSTVTTTVPNFVRGAVVPMSALFAFTKSDLGLVGAAGLVGGGAVVIALIALYFLEETHGRDLDFIEKG
jgi:MFS family permease